MGSIDKRIFLLIFSVHVDLRVRNLFYKKYLADWI